MLIPKHVQDKLDQIELTGEEREAIAKICKLGDYNFDNLTNAMKSTPEHRRKWKVKQLKELIQELESD